MYVCNGVFPHFSAHPHPSGRFHENIAKGIIAAFAAVVCMLGSISRLRRNGQPHKRTYGKALRPTGRSMRLATPRPSWRTFMPITWAGPWTTPCPATSLGHQIHCSPAQVRQNAWSDITPAAIKIHGDVAFVHYHYTRVTKDSMAKEKQTSGRWTDILKNGAKNGY